jgi:TonB family protein
VTYDTPHAGVLRRAFRKIAAEDYVPPSPIRKVSPVSHGNATTIDVKVSIDASGSVTRAQVLTKGSSLAGEAVAAAERWQFSPARKHDKPAPSEMVLHFRF